MPLPLTIPLSQRLDDIATPEDMIALLRQMSQRFYEDASELQAAWQDDSSGKFWARIARDLDRVADKAEKYKP